MVGCGTLSFAWWVCLGGVVPVWTVDFRSACGLGIDLVYWCGLMLDFVLRYAGVI